MRQGQRSLAAAAAGLLAVLAAGCGSSQGLLSARSHDALAAQLLAVRQAVSQGDCAKTSDALAELDTVIDGLPPQTNGTLDRNLRQGASVVRKNAARQCHRKRPKPPVKTTTSTTSTTTTQTHTATSSSTPAPPTSTAAPPATSTSTPPPSTVSSTTASSPSGPPSTNTTGGGGLKPGGGANSGGGGSGNGSGDG